MRKGAEWLLVAVAGRAMVRGAAEGEHGAIVWCGTEWGRSTDGSVEIGGLGSASHGGSSEGEPGCGEVEGGRARYGN